MRITIWQWKRPWLHGARGVVLDLVEALEGEAENWIATGRARTTPCPPSSDDGGLGQRAVDDAIAAEAPVQILRHAEDAAVHPHVLADDEHVGVALHLLQESQIQRLDHVQLCHMAPVNPSRCR
jgi:hypothetical protein